MWLAAALLAAPALAGGDLEAGGAVRSNLHLGVLSCEGNVSDCPWLEFQDLLVISGHLRGEPTEGVAFAVKGGVRLHQGTLAEDLEDTAFSSDVQPWSLDIDEAWVEAGDLLFEGMDLRIGQQRFAWGVAEGVNPLDVVNPYDLADPTRFDQRLGISAA